MQGSNFFPMTILHYNIVKKRLRHMSVRTQLLKGILEGCILKIIEEGPIYGYALSQKLHEAGLTDVTEGTIYPVLMRLQRSGYIKGEMRPSEAGPDRKYYTITETGKAALTNIIVEWKQLVPPVNQLLLGRESE